MTRSVFFACCVLALSVVSLGCDPPTVVRPRRDTGTGDTDGGGGPIMPDEDGDGIPDTYEGRASNEDTDGDGTPDYLDADSDGDGLTDMLEGGNPGGQPVDTDGDGTPDFRDLDSDGNGISDAVEGEADPDGDLSPNSRDNDNDGDTVTDREELGSTMGSPIDTDGDGTPDYLDTDSDNDLISDRDESIVDTDRDLTVDRWDADSDDDGIPDTDEAGDADVGTPPVDTDGDRIADFRDTDSDGDGLSDAAEHEFDLAHPGSMTVTDADSDDDGVSDLVEVASGTDPLDATDSPRTRGDFVFLEPYMMPPEPPMDTLDFATNLRRADVYFLMDTTGSMGGEINNLKSSIASVLIPEIRTRIPEAEMGVGNFDDYPTGGFGGGSDLPFRNFQSITADDAAVIAGVNMYSLHGGADGPESGLQAIFASIDGNPLTWPGGMAPSAPASCPPEHFGYACFRPDAVPIIVVFMDTNYHNGPGGSNPYSFPAPDYATTRDALNTRRARVITVHSGGGVAAEADARQMATDTGTVDPGSGDPLVYTISGTGTGLSTAVVDGIAAVAQLTLDISTRYDDDTSDTVDTFPAFVMSLVPDEDGDAARGCDALAAIDTNGDGVNDTFPGVTPGTRVCFNIVVKQNDTVMQTAVPQLFRATITVLGDGFTPLDSRDVFFLVPPSVEPPGGPD